ncbi:MAG: glycosyltransferase [Balneolaceae bacterium]
MKNKIRLSIILTTHGKEAHFNELLSGVLSFEGEYFEVIVINDSADMITTTFIEREISKSNNDRIYLFNHSEKRGRGASLNEGIVQAEGSLIWAPLRADRLNESLLVEAINRFRSEPVAFWVMDYNLPESAEEWIDSAGDGDLPEDSCMVWNRDVIRADQLFFNPFMEQLHGAELTFRLAHDHAWKKTDPFFVIAEDQSCIASEQDQKEFLYSALRGNPDANVRASLLTKLNESSFINSKIEADHQNLVEARKFLQLGDANKSLELINLFLKRNPENQEGFRIKIASLEKQRRHVEAAELKHNLYKKRKSLNTAPAVQENIQEEPSAEKSQSQSQSQSIELSVVIPTTAHGKLMLEQALVSLEQTVDKSSTELIVVDNASIDDTFDYLEQLTKKEYLNIKVIVNQVNKGFAASVNQGLNMAKGDYVMVMHNDVVPHKDCTGKLMQTLKQSKEVALVAPLLNQTELKKQRIDRETEDKIVAVDLVDSCCFMVRKELPVRFDDGYQACYFEMNDYCKQIKEHGASIVVVADATAEHHQGGSTESMAFHLNPEAKWKNRARYLKKWMPGKPNKIPAEGNHAERFQKLGAPYNPVSPDSEWVETINKYLTNEVRTEILRGKWTEDELLTIILTLLIADERELLRSLEDRMVDAKPDSQLLTLIILYYFNKNIFSRCRHYIGMSEDQEPLFEFFDLKMLVTDKEFDKAIPLLNRLLEKYPSSPELFYLAAEVYKNSNEEGEAKSFYAMANQLDPFRFRNEDVAFDINI